MNPFQAAVRFVLEFEGGYSNDPRDPGGETNWGISKRSYPDLDIKALTRDEAIALYKRDFWDRCRCDELPAPLAFMTFDSAVNQGIGTASLLLQAAVHASGDGVIGPATVAAANRANVPQSAASMFAGRCLQYALNKSVSIYGFGWFRRAALCFQMAIQPL